MPRYLLIESRDPFDSNDTGFCRDLATQLAAGKNDVTLFLVQNGVLPARSGARSGDLTKLGSQDRVPPRGAVGDVIQRRGVRVGLAISGAEFVR